MRSRSTVDYCASNQGAFFDDFVAAMTKLGRIGVKTPATGVEIRRDCRFSNTGYLISPTVLSRLKETNKKQVDNLPHNILIVLT